MWKSLPLLSALIMEKSEHANLLHDREGGKGHDEKTIGSTGSEWNEDSKWKKHVNYKHTIIYYFGLLFYFFLFHFFNSLFFYLPHRLEDNDKEKREMK